MMKRKKKLTLSMSPVTFFDDVVALKRMLGITCAARKIQSKKLVLKMRKRQSDKRLFHAAGAKFKL